MAGGGKTKATFKTMLDSMSPRERALREREEVLNRDYLRAATHEPDKAPALKRRCMAVLNQIHALLEPGFMAERERVNKGGEMPQIRKQGRRGFLKRKEKEGLCQ